LVCCTKKNLATLFQTAWLITLSMLGKLSITSAYSIIYIFSAEIFPTPIRNVGIGAASMSARIGGTRGPFLTSPLGASFDPQGRI
jgi:hypothetical protein